MQAATQAVVPAGRMQRACRQLLRRRGGSVVQCSWNCLRTCCSRNKSSSSVCCLTQATNSHVSTPLRSLCHPCTFLYCFWSVSACHSLTLLLTSSWCWIVHDCLFPRVRAQHATTSGPSVELVSAVALALTVPLIRPLRWQSLLLPILPHKLLSFLDAPVPFVVGLPRPATGCVVMGSSCS